MIEFFRNRFCFLLRVSASDQGVDHKGLDLIFIKKAVVVDVIMTEYGFVDHFELLVCYQAGAFLLNHFLNYGNEKFRRIYNVCSIVTKNWSVKSLFKILSFFTFSTFISSDNIHLKKNNA